MTGQRIITQSLTAHQISFSIQLPPGMYFGQVSGPNSRGELTKIIILL
jgi:hypothetical protein